MKNITFNVHDFAAKVRAARVDMASIDQLRANPPSTEGEAFMVAKMLYVWAGDDTTPDDGVNSVRPASMPSKSRGRYRRAGLAFPQIRE